METGRAIAEVVSRTIVAFLRPVEKRLAAAGLRMMGPWERLSVPTQVMVAFPTLAVVLFLFHLGPLNQPLIRAAFYGVFWSVLFTPILILATQNELRKRRDRDESGPLGPGRAEGEPGP
jgi:hypothetical protein